MTGKLLAFCSLPPYPDPSLVTFDPEVPMDFPLQPLVPGTIIELTGHVHNHTKRFSINLVTGKGDIALHVNPRFDAGNTVFNTLRGNEWETEEVVQSVPVQQGQNFECMILVEQMDYKVAFNGMHFAEFKHRLLFSLVERLNVEGTVTIHTAEQKPPLGTVVGADDASLSKATASYGWPARTSLAPVSVGCNVARQRSRAVGLLQGEEEKPI